MALCSFFILIFIGTLLPDYLFAQSADFLIVSPKDQRKMDYEGEFMSDPPNEKQAWYWDSATIDGWNKLYSRKTYYGRAKIQFKTKSCVNNSDISIHATEKNEPWNLWASSNGYIRSNCGPGFRLRRVGGWIKVIDDDPCKFTEDDKFLLKVPKTNFYADYL